MSTLTYQQIKQLATQQMKKQEAIARQSDMLNIAELNERYYSELAHGTVLCHADNRKGNEWEDHSYIKKEWNAKRGAYDYIYDTSSAKSQANREASDRTAYERQKALSTYGANPITRTPFTNVNYSVNKPAQSTNNQLNPIQLMSPQISDMLAAKQAREQHEYKKTFAANSNVEGLKRAQAGQYNPGAANSLNSSVQQTTGRNIANMIAKNGTTSGNSANSLNSEIQRSAGRDAEAKARDAGKTHADTMNKMMLQTQANRELPMKNGVAQRLSNAPGEQSQGQAMQAKQMSDAELSKMAGRENNYNMQSRSLTPDQQRERDRQLAISRQNNANMQSQSLTPDQQRELSRQQNVSRQNQYNMQSQSLTPDQQRELSRQQNVARQNQYNIQSKSLSPDQQREASRQQKDNNLSEKFRIYDNNALNESSRKYGEIARNGGIDSAVKATMQDQTVKNLLNVLPDAVRNGEIKITTGKDGKVEYSGTKDAVDYMNKVADWLDSVSKNAGPNRNKVRDKLEEAIDKEIKLAVSKGSVQNKGELRSAKASDGDSQSDKDYGNKLASALKGNLNYDEKNQSKGLSEAIAMNTKSTGPNRSDDISGKDLADALRNNIKTQDATNDRLYAEKRAANKKQEDDLKKDNYTTETQYAGNHYIEDALRMYNNKEKRNNIREKIEEKLKEKGIIKGSYSGQYQIASGKDDWEKTGESHKNYEKINTLLEKIQSQEKPDKKDLLAFEDALHEFTMKDSSRDIRAALMIKEAVDDVLKEDGKYEDLNAWNKNHFMGVNTNYINNLMNKYGYMLHSDDYSNDYQQSLTPEQEFANFKRLVEMGRQNMQKRNDGIIIHDGMVSYYKDVSDSLAHSEWGKGYTDKYKNKNGNWTYVYDTNGGGAKAQANREAEQRRKAEQSKIAANKMVSNNLMKIAAGAAAENNPYVKFAEKSLHYPGDSKYQYNAHKYSGQTEARRRQEGNKWTGLIKKDKSDFKLVDRDFENGNISLQDIDKYNYRMTEDEGFTDPVNGKSTFDGSYVLVTGGYPEGWKEKSWTVPGYKDDRKWTDKDREYLEKYNKALISHVAEFYKKYYLEKQSLGRQEANNEIEKYLRYIINSQPQFIDEESINGMNEKGTELFYELYSLCNKEIRHQENMYEAEKATKERQNRVNNYNMQSKSLTPDQQRYMKK